MSINSKNIVLIILFSSITLTSCVEEFSFETDYNQFLDHHSFIELVNNDIWESEDIYFNVARASLNNNEEVVLYDQVSSSFLYLDRKENTTRSFGNKGSGPFEYQMFTQTYLSAAGDFYVYDMGNSKIIKYPKSGEPLEFTIKYAPIDFVVNIEGEILIYHLTAEEENVLSLFNEDGQEINQAFVPEDQLFKIFLNQFKDGGLSYSSKENLYYFLYPEEYKIHVLDSSLQIKESISLKGESIYPRESVTIPQNLNPYGMSQSHWDFWTSFHHSSRVSLVGSTHILVRNYEIYSPSDWQVYHNLYTKAGEVVFEGLIFPDSVNVIEADSDFINISYDSGITQYSIR